MWTRCFHVFLFQFSILFDLSRLRVYLFQKKNRGRGEKQQTNEKTFGLYNKTRKLCALVPFLALLCHNLEYIAEDLYTKNRKNGINGESIHIRSNKLEEIQLDNQWIRIRLLLILEYMSRLLKTLCNADNRSDFIAFCVALWIPWTFFRYKCLNYYYSGRLMIFSLNDLNFLEII